MSTQDDSGIPFEICNDQQQLRLLELPPSILELITSKRIYKCETAASNRYSTTLIGSRALR